MRITRHDIEYLLLVALAVLGFVISVASVVVDYLEK